MKVDFKIPQNLIMNNYIAQKKPTYPIKTFFVVQFCLALKHAQTLPIDLNPLVEDNVFTKIYLSVTKIFSVG